MSLFVEQIDGIARDSVDILNHYPGPVIVGCAVASSIIVLLMCRRWIKDYRPKDQDVEMKRRALLDQKYADAFHDALLTMLGKDEITKHEYRRDCRRFGIAYRLTDLLVKKNPRRGMRFRIQKNVTDMHRTPSLAGKPIGDHPRNDHPVVVVAVASPKQRKVWVARLTRKSA